MSKVVKYCRKCINNPEKHLEHLKNITGFSIENINKFFTLGYFTPNEEDNIVFCQYHPEESLQNSILTIEEYEVISEISTDKNFICAMNDLKEKDIIEYNLKMSQFKAQLSQTKQTEEGNIPKCPTCGSTKLSKVSTASKAGSVFMFGLLSQKVKKTWHCDNCKYEW